jgi:hypothetical protein
MGIIAEDIKQYDTTIVSKKDANLLSTITNAFFGEKGDNDDEGGGSSRSSSKNTSKSRTSAESINSFLANMQKGSKEMEEERKRLDTEKAKVAEAAQRLDRLREALGINSEAEERARHAKPYSTSIAYADENTTVLMNQLAKAGIKPLQFIPLAQIRVELSDLFVKASAGEAFNEARVDHLLACMEVNPEYMAEKEAADRAWREEIAEFTASSLAEMRGYVPPFIFTTTKVALMQEWGVGAELAKRLIEKKCLWLLRMNEDSIKKLHAADLMGRYTYEAQGLDIVEIAALYAAIPAKFGNDASGKKQLWQSKLEVRW